MMFDDTYKMLSAPGEGLYKEKGSKFIATAFTVTSEEEVKQALAEVKKKYYDARHHCYAYMIGPDKSCFRSSDDGEPSGTAGKPILNQILSKDVTNVCVIVVRYFGNLSATSLKAASVFSLPKRSIVANKQRANMPGRSFSKVKVFSVSWSAYTFLLVISSKKSITFSLFLLIIATKGLSTNNSGCSFIIVRVLASSYSKRVWSRRPCQVE